MEETRGDPSNITGLRHELHQSLAINGGRVKKRSR